MRQGIAATLIGLCAACGGSRLPTERPADFSISVQSTGGMLPVASRMRCDVTGCTWRTTDSRGAVPEEKRPVSSVQLDALYGVVRQQAFDRIRLEKHAAIFDVAGVDVAVTAAGGSYALGYSATESVAKDDEGRYRAVIAAVEALVSSLREANRSPDPDSPPPAR